MDLSEHFIEVEEEVGNLWDCESPDGDKAIIDWITKD